MSTTGPIFPELEHLVTTATQTVLANIDDKATEIIRHTQSGLQSAKQMLTDEMESRHKTLLAKIEAKDPRSWQLAMVLVPTVATALLGLLVFHLQIDTNAKIDRTGKLLSTRLALSQQFYQQRFTIYNDADKRMVRLLAAANNMDRNPKDTDMKKQAAILLTQLNVSSRTSSFYMTQTVSDGLANVWSIATELPQLSSGGTKKISDLDAAVKTVEEQMRKELLVNIESVDSGH